MRITILGGGGFLGRKVAQRLARDGTLGGQPVTELTLFDLVPPPKPEAGFAVHALGGDIAELPDAAIPPGTDVVFHLAAVVSAAAEADYDLGRRVNLRGTDAVVDACRALGRPPRVVFTSSVASFGGGQSAVLGDDARQVPANSYGAQKAAAELILADASRRGFLDAVCLRLPTIVIRPGRPNKAASSFVSGILREPLLGLPADLPVPDDFAVWIASPRRAVEWLLHAAAMDTGPMELDRSVNPPGIRGGPLPPDLAWRARATGAGLAAADAVIAPSASFARALRVCYGVTRHIEVVHNGRRSIAVPGRRGTVALTAGRLWDEGKGVKTLDAAAARVTHPVLAAGPVSGPGGERADCPHLQLSGSLDEAALAAAYASAAVFVAVGRYEPFGLAVLEAAQSGCALLLSDIPTFRELWDEAAVFVAPDDAAGLARTLQTMLDDPARCTTAGARALESSRRFDPARMAAATWATHAAVLRREAA